MKRLFNVSVWLGCRTLALLACFALLGSTGAYAQGVTTGAISGLVTDATKAPVAGATVIAIHLPSGTSYEAVTNAEGRFALPNMRIGGPYTVTVTPAVGGAAFDPQVQDSIEVNLGTSTDLEFNVAALSETVTVTAQSDTVFSSNRTGAATTISRDTLATLPSISQRLQDIVRLTPQSSGGMSFAGQDSRMNNITVDGSYFNNSFGLRNTPGDTSGVAPISLQSIEQVQVSIAPYDVRQGNFVGAGVNTVTRSGTNQIRGSVYHQFRDEGLVGTEAKQLTVNPGTFQFRNTGGWGAGPIVKNRLFVFGNYENESLTSPGTIFSANPGGQPAVGSMTRVLASDLNNLTTLLGRLDYETGPYEGYNFATPAIRALFKTDFNLNSQNKAVFRYIHLDSSTDRPVSDSNSLGFGNRQGRVDSLSFQNSAYAILEDIRSFVGEVNTIFGTRMSNSLIVGYSKHDESRESKGGFFPLVDILEGGRTYTAFGAEPFTPNNVLKYNSFQVQDNFTIFNPKHSLTFGFSAERYESLNIFYSGSQSVYVYNSLNDFITDANGFLANPNRTTSPVQLERFQVRYNNIPGQEFPVQPLEVLYVGAYAQDDWRMRSNLSLTYGLRFDIPYFGETGYTNAVADAMTFRDEGGNPVQYQTGKLPDPNILWSPRLGFNWDLRGNRNTQVRGGTGVFTGKPAYVWISNQIGTTGVLTGFDDFRSPGANAQLALRPFNPDPNRYKPTNVTGAPAASTELAVTDADFKFPQVWRSNIAVDQRLPWGWRGTAEFIYNRDVNGLYYINANLPAAQTAFSGVDTRPRWTSNRLNNPAANQIVNNIVLKNQDVGRNWNVAFSADRSLKGGLWLKSAYSYGRARNTIDPGSIASGSWNNNTHSGDPNNPGVGYSNNSPGHRVFMAASYTKEYFKFGGTTVSAYWEARTLGNSSVTFGADMNGDAGGFNDLIYIPRDASEMNFRPITGATPFSAAQQAEAFDSYINSNKYLREHRGQYAERGAVFLPLVKSMDLSVSQDFFMNLAGRRHSFQFRADFLNFGNLLNDNWGVAQRFTSNSPLVSPQVDAQGRSSYQLRVISGALVSKTFEQTAGLLDVYRVQFSLRYTF